jgi:4-amino-4-deoxy-L-arabinose transferase-like glycosyltransferase
VRVWWSEIKMLSGDHETQFRVFTLCWLLIPIIFFSISQSKLPGYILPCIPAGTILLADYLLRHREDHGIPKWTAVLHALVASAPVVPAVLVAYIVTQHRMPGGRPMLVAVAIAFGLCLAISLTLVSRQHLRMLRFVTLIPVILAIAALLKVGTTAID